MLDTITQGIAILQILLQYLFLSPVNFLLTFISPIVFHLIHPKYIWLSILLTVIIELMIKWGEFNAYESRGLMIFFTLLQIAVMAVFIWMLKSIGAKTKK